MAWYNPEPNFSQEEAIRQREYLKTPAYAIPDTTRDDPRYAAEKAKIAQRYNTSNPNWSGYTTPGSPFYRGNENTAPAAAIQTIPNTPPDYTAFRMTPEERGRRNASVGAGGAAMTPDARWATAVSGIGPNNEYQFNDASMRRAGYDRAAVYDQNVVPAAQAGAMLGTMMNPKGDQALSGALRAAAARGDWDAVGRYYASQGQTFGGKMYGAGGGADMDQLYRTAMGLDGTGPQSYRKRDRAATILNQLSNQQSQYDIANLGAEAQRFGAEQVAKVGQERNKVYGAMNLGAQRQRTAAANVAQDQKFIEWIGSQEGQAKLRSLKPDSPEYKSYRERERVALIRTMGFDPSNPLAEIPPEGYARGGQVQPVLNPMGNMGMPSSMADLDPVIRQYAQYVSTASQYGLQPVAFPKFIDLLGTARTQLASLPTQGGATGFAEGGKVEEDNMYYVKQYNEQGEFTGYKAYPRSEMPKDDSGRPYWVPQEEWKKNTPNNNRYANGGMVDWLKSFLPGVGPLDTPAPAATPAQTDQQRLGQGAAMLGSGMAGQAAQALQGRRSALEEALQAAQGARGGYAMGGAIPVAGRQVLGPGGPKSDSIPAVINGSRPAALSDGEFVMPTEAVQFYGTDKLNKMIQKARGQ